MNNQWLSEILIDLVWEIDSRRLQVHRDVLKIKDIYGVELDHAESLILSKLESIEQEAYKKGYNSGWVAANRNTGTKKYIYFAEQLEDAASKLRNIEAELKGKG